MAMVDYTVIAVVEWISTKTPMPPVGGSELRTVKTGINFWLFLALVLKTIPPKVETAGKIAKHFLGRPGGIKQNFTIAPTPGSRRCVQRGVYHRRFRFDRQWKFPGGCNCLIYRKADRSDYAAIKFSSSANLLFPFVLACQARLNLMNVPYLPYVGGLTITQAALRLAIHSYLSTRVRASHKGVIAQRWWWLTAIPTSIRVRQYRRPIYSRPRAWRSLFWQSEVTVQRESKKWGIYAALLTKITCSVLATVKSFVDVVKLIRLTNNSLQCKGV